ncbi:MAG: tetratricopeptide repeat protein [Thalassotalea sp.]
MIFFNYTAILLLTLLVSACSSTVDDNTRETTANANEEIKTLGQDMADIPLELTKSNKTAEPHGNQSASPENTIAAEQRGINTANPYQQFLAQQLAFKAVLPADIKQQYQIALAELTAKNWSGALTLLTSIIEQQPDFSGAYVNKTLAHYHLKQVNLALTSLQKAKQHSDNNPYIYNLQGVLAREQGLFEAAEKHYQQALAIWPDYAAAHLNMAVLYELYRGDFAQAKKHYQVYIMLNPNDQLSKNWLAGLEIKLASRQVN